MIVILDIIFALTDIEEWLVREDKLLMICLWMFLLLLMFAFS